MQRVSEALVSSRAARVGERLGTTLRVSGRNGYMALDRYQPDVGVQTLKTGTKSEIYTYLEAMSEALAIVNR